MGNDILSVAHGLELTCFGEFALTERRSWACRSRLPGYRLEGDSGDVILKAVPFFRKGQSGRERVRLRVRESLRRLISFWQTPGFILSIFRNTQAVPHPELTGQFYGFF